MVLVEQEQEEEVNIYSQIFILPGTTTIVESHNIETKQDEFIEEKYTCAFCSTFLLTPGYCSDPNIKTAVSPRYHCNKSKKS